jgi:hypothetical protein
MSSRYQLHSCTRRPVRRLLLIAPIAGCLMALGTAPASAASTAAWWGLSSATRPTNLPPGGTGTLFVVATNLGDGAINAKENPITISDTLPAGVEATGVEAQTAAATKEGLTCRTTPAISCTFTGQEPGSGTARNWELFPSERLEMVIKVKLVGPVSGVNEVQVSGGAIAPATTRRALSVSPALAPFGVERYEFAVEGSGGSPDTQAGSHPFQVTTTIQFSNNVRLGCPPNIEFPCLLPGATPKDLSIALPAGLVGDSSAVPQCTEAEFATEIGDAADLCPDSTAIGVAAVLLKQVGNFPEFTVESPIFSLVPSTGEPARFGFEVEHVPITLDASVRTGRDYGITISSDNTDELPELMAVQTTFWGVPGDERHNASRGWDCLRGELFHYDEFLPACVAEHQGNPVPLLTMPTACAGPLTAPLELNSWAEPAPVTAEPDNEMVSLTGCNQIPFSGGIETAPDSQEGSTASGLKVDVHVPQSASLDANGLSGSDVKTIEVTLPEGVALNPSAADGLEACSESEIGFEGVEQPSGADLFSDGLPAPKEAPALPFCPDGSKIGTAKITTPLLAHPLEGSVYLAAQDANPFGSLVAMYLVVEDPVSGVLLKLTGEVSLNPTTGQITTAFSNQPQAPFEDAELHFFGGERAPLSTPSRCGTYTTTAVLTPWSGNATVESSSTFDITSGPHGSPCPGSSLPFSPSLTAGVTNINAGGFTPLVTTIGREDGEQNIQSVTLHMPPGLSGILTGVKLCGEAQANAGTCGPESLIGSTIVSVGFGGDPYSVTGGKVYLTEGYKGASFGLSIVTPAVAGPYNLGTVVVRAKLEVNPATAALTVTTDNTGPYKIPSILDGIPLEIKHVHVTIERPGFTFNPTSCEPMQLTGAISSVEGASSPVSTSFQVTNCAALKFQPKIAVSVGGHASKSDGASLHFKISYPKGAQGSDSWFKEAKFDLPKQLPARLETLQQACLAHTFETNRTACPKHSVIGEAVVHTPILPVPLKGKIYFVSYGGAKFPDAVIVLEGYGITVDLTGETFINHKTGVTSATFASTPDVPFESIEVTLPTGEYSEFGANLPHESFNFCGRALKMPTLLKAQNGLEIKQSTPIAVTGCSKVKHAKAKHASKRKRNKHG